MLIIGNRVIRAVANFLKVYRKPKLLKSFSLKENDLHCSLSAPKHQGICSKFPIFICLGLAISAPCLSSAQTSGGVQFGPAYPADKEHPVGLEHETMPDRLLGKPSLPPALSIAAKAFGLPSPGAIVRGHLNSEVSLNFLGEDRLLFTFRVPEQLERRAFDGDANVPVHAVVLTLPTGDVESQATWHLHNSDSARYLWPLKDGSFLLRDGDSIQQGNAALTLKPQMRFVGTLLRFALDPTEHFLVAESREPATTPAGSGGANNATGGRNPKDGRDFVVRVLRRDTGQAVTVNRVRSVTPLAINAEGYLDFDSSRGTTWTLNLIHFDGERKVLGHVDSTCAPTADFISETEVLVTGCLGMEPSLVALDTDGHRLWKKVMPGAMVCPLLSMSQDGSYFARETLVASHGLGPAWPCNNDDVEGQLVRVFHASDGKISLQTPSSPAVDSGGNMALSPSGRRVAVLNAGVIQIFNLQEQPK